MSTSRTGSAKRWPSLATLLLTTIALPCAAIAQEDEPRAETGEEAATLETVIVTGYRVGETAGGTRISTPLKDLPMSVQVVNQALIKDLGADRIEDAVRLVSGINKVNRNDNLGRGERFAIRGFNSSMVLRNGVPYNVSSDTVNIEQIDVVKGANSILYGFNDPGGLINYVTKQPLSEAEYTFSQAVGSEDYYRTQADLTGPIAGGLKYRLMASYTDRGSHLENGMEKKLVINPVLTWDITDRTSVTLDYNYHDIDGRFQRDAYPMLRDASGTYVGYADFGRDYSPIFPDDENTDQAENIELRFSHHFNDKLTLRIAGAHTEIDSDQFNMIGFAMDPEEESMLARRNLRAITRYQSEFVFADLSAEFRTPYMKHRLVTGGQYRFAKSRSFSAVGAFAPTLDMSNLPTDPSVRYFRPETREQLGTNVFFSGVGGDNHGFFITDQISLDDNRTTILIGARYDDLGAGGTNITPQFGVNYELNDLFSVYGLYSESFRPNGTYTYQTTGQTVYFDPEKGVNIEAGVKFSLFDSRFSGSLALFELTRENVLQSTASSDPLTPILSLSGEERSRGVELDFSGELTDRLNLFGSYAYMEAEIVNNPQDATLEGLALEGVSPNNLSVFARYDFGTIGPGELSGNLGFMWRDGPIQQYNTWTYRNLVTDEYTSVDAGLDYTLPNDLSLSLKVTNLTDEVYFDRRSAYAAPRAVRFYLRKTF